MADLHLFCGQVAPILGLDAAEHLAKAKEYARDISEFSDLYESPNLDFYNGIPEYEMLQRGMTDEERIENGYRLPL